MEAILFGFFLGALAGGAAAVVVLRILKDRRTAEFDKLVVSMTGLLPDDTADPADPKEAACNLMRHNNLDWMFDKEGESA